MNAFEIGILNAIQNLRAPALDTFMSLVTRLGDGGIFWILLTLLFLIFPKTRRLGAACAAALLIDVVICNGIIKPLVARTRPYDVNTAIVLLVPKPSDYSFPSGHSAASFTVVGALYFRRSKLWIPAAALATIIAASRLYLYIHYPTDVLAGIVLGIIFGFLGVRAADWPFKIAKKRRNS